MCISELPDDIREEVMSWVIPVINYNQVLYQLSRNVQHSWLSWRTEGLNEWFNEHHIRYNLFNTNSWQTVRVEYQWDVVDCMCCENELVVRRYDQPMINALENIRSDELTKMYCIP